jgi:glycosyltransferase involved in cell wall biosynthesis
MNKEKPIRVLQVFGIMNTGGAENMIMNIYRNIDRTKVQFDFVIHTEKKGFYDDEINQLGGNIYRIPRFKGKNIFSYINSWETLFGEHKEYSIVHSHIRSTASIILKIAKKYGITTISHSHSTSNGKGFQAVVKNMLQYPLKYISDYMFACSKKTAISLYGNEAYETGKVKILNNAIDTERFIYDKQKSKQIKKQLGVENNFVVGHVGRFSYPKNHDFLLDIFYEIKKIKKDAILLLIGDGELRDKIKEKVQKLKLTDYVIFMGVRSDIPELMQAMDVFLFPSHFEGLPVVLVEAQASGLKILASDTITKEVALTDLVNFYSLNSTPTEWANKTLNCLDGYIRRSYSTEIKNANYDIIENAKWLENFYLTLHSNSKNGGNNG